MNRSDLAARVAERRDLSPRVAEEIVGSIFEAMADELARGGRVEIRGFGTFSMRDYAPYRGRNPRTGESVWVEAKRLPYFKVGKEMRERLQPEVAERRELP